MVRAFPDRIGAGRNQMNKGWLSRLLGSLAVLVPLLFYGHGGSAAFVAATKESADPEVSHLMAKSLKSRQTDVRQAALAWLARDPRAQNKRLIRAVFRTLKDKDPGVRNQALANLGWIYERDFADKTGRRALAAVKKALANPSDHAAALVAVDLLRGSAEKGEYDENQGGAPKEHLLSNPGIQTLVVPLLASRESSLRPELLQVVENSPLLQSLPPVIEAVGEALGDDDLTVRSDAADLLIAIDRKGKPEALAKAHPLLLRALAEGDPNVQIRVSRALNLPVPPRKAAPPVLSLTGEKVSTADVPFDFNYFTAFVQPLFAKKYGGEACVDCHTPQANTTGKFRVMAPKADGHYTVEESRVNFVSVLAVVDRANLEKSKVLLKPLDPRASEGKLQGETHDGGVFWRNQFDPDFRLVDDWLKGAKLDVPPQKQLDFAYFMKHVEPIFSTPGPDGFACINCHSTHAILHLESPETREGSFSIEQMANNYQSAHRVIDESAPGSSFIVRKPTSPREGANGLAHAGGIRWPDKKDSWQYRTLIDWMGKRNLDGQ